MNNFQDSINEIFYNGQKKKESCFPDLSTPISKEQAQHYLRNAVRNDDIKAIEVCLEAGAEINKDILEDSGTPLHLAAETGNAEAAAKLLELGATIDINSGAWEMTPLGTAVWCDQCEVVNLLLTKGANVNSQDPDGRNAFYYAADNGCPDCAKMLHDSGLQVKVKCLFGLTPLHNAACRGNISVVESMLSWGAELNAVDDFGETPLDCAINYKHDSLVEFLKQKGGYSKSDNQKENGSCD